MQSEAQSREEKRDSDNKETIEQAIFLTSKSDSQMHVYSIHLYKVKG